MTAYQAWGQNPYKGSITTAVNAVVSEAVERRRVRDEAQRVKDVADQQARAEQLRLWHVKWEAEKARRRPDMTTESMVGLTMASVMKSGDDEMLTFVSDTGLRFLYHHLQACCEDVSIEDINGDLDDLVGSPILEASMRSEISETHDSGTWTFYHFATIKGSVVVRWLGTSNGCYGEEVDLRVDQLDN